MEPGGPVRVDRRAAAGPPRTPGRVGGGGFGGGVPSSAALTASIGSRRSASGVVALTGGMTAVSPASGGTDRLPARRRRRCRPPPSGRRTGVWVGARHRSAACPYGHHWLTGRGALRYSLAVRAPSRASVWTRSLRGPDRAEHIRLDQVIPAAGAAYLHHVYGELVVAGGQQDQLLGGARRTRHGAEMVTEHPRHQRELFLAADRAHHRTGLPMELRGPQQVRIGVADLRDAGASRVDLGQQGPPPKRIVHHLSLQSHDDQSTSAATAEARLRRGLRFGHLRRWRPNSTIIVVATRQTAGTRAKDSDRNDTCQILDSALSEGQLSMEEHRQRVSAATNAATLGELQRWSRTCRPRTRRSAAQPQEAVAARRRRLGHAGGGRRRAGRTRHRDRLGLYGNTSSPLTSPPTGAKSTDRPKVLTRQLHSLGGLTGLLEQMRRSSGHHGSGWWSSDSPRDRPDPNEERRKLSYAYRGGWGTQIGPSRRRPGDLGKFDLNAVIGVLRGLPKRSASARRRKSSTYLIIDPAKDPTTPDASTARSTSSATSAAATSSSPPTAPSSRSTPS